MHDELQAPLALMVNTFISDIQTHITDRHRALSMQYLDLAFPANKDRTNHDVVPQSPVPWNLREGHMTSSWRGHTTMPPATVPLTMPSVAVHTSDPQSCSNSVTPPPSPAPTTSSSVASSVSPASITYSDDEWFSQDDICRAIDEVSENNNSLSHERLSYMSPPLCRTSVRRQSLSPVSQSPELRRTPEPLSFESHAPQSQSLKLHTRTRRTDSDDNMYWSGPLFWSDNTSVTAPRPTSVSVPSTKPATFPYLKDPIAGNPAVGAHGPPIAVLNQPLSQASVSVTKGAYPAFDPIIPPGPHTKRWIDENRWHPRWANTFRDVAETYSQGKWVHILVTQYKIPMETAEAIVACIMYDLDVQRTSTSSFTL